MKGLKRLFKNKHNKKFRKKGLKQVIPENTYNEIANNEITHEYKPIENDFVTNMSNCIGETVTIFVNGGGLSGLGFTGILLDVNSIYVKLITAIGPAPSCALFNSCFYFKSCMSTAYKNLGSLTYIPVHKIASFVHNLL